MTKLEEVIELRKMGFGVRCRKDFVVILKEGVEHIGFYKRSSAARWLEKQLNSKDESQR